MGYLLDTHFFLWWLEDDKRLQKRTRNVITDSRNQIFVSVVSAWEISVKRNIGKLSLRSTIQECFEKSGFTVLNITLHHIFTLDTLPNHHKDPFDRMLIAQTHVEHLTLVTDDAKIKKYDVKIL